MMKKITGLLISSLLAAVILGSCGGNTTRETDDTAQAVQVKQNQFENLITYIENSGDLINSKIVPTMIDAEEVYANLNHYPVIDIRRPADYNNGHISGAKNLQMEELIPYFENQIDAPSFSKIVLVCYAGQSSSFATSILRMLGYDNVFAIRWGMSAWDASFAGDRWLSNSTNNFADQLELQPNPKGPANGYPEVMTTKTDGYAILRERAIQLLNNGFEKYSINVNELFETKDNYYIINYWPEDLYSLGHFPGAIQYDPKKSLGRATFLSTLPPDKTIVPYCFTGQHSAFVIAYLNLIGYNAKSLNYGANSFMNGVMMERDPIVYHAFSKTRIHGYPFVVDKSDPAAQKAMPVGEIKTAPAGGC